MNSMLAVNGLLWAQPVADVLSLILAMVLYFISYGKRVRQIDKGAGELEI